MRWWMWVAAAVGVVVIVALAAAWVALTTARADIERQDDRLEGLERQPGTPAVIGDRLDALEGQIARLAEVQGQIADALDRLDALEGRVASLVEVQGQIADALDRLDALEGRVASLVEVQGQIADALDRIEALENQASPTAPSLTPVLDRIEALGGPGRPGRGGSQCGPWIGPRTASRRWRTKRRRQRRPWPRSSVVSRRWRAGSGAGAGGQPDHLGARQPRGPGGSGARPGGAHRRPGEPSAADSAIPGPDPRSRRGAGGPDRGAGAGGQRITSALDRLAALATRVADLERQAAQPGQSETQFIIANTVQTRDYDVDGIWVEFCIIYTVPGGVQERCYHGEYEQTGPNTLSLTPLTQWVADCFFPARIGDPLPDCWR